MKKIFTLVILCTLCLFSAQNAASQVTTSSLNGVVTDGEQPLVGATVVAIHEPSGTTYGMVTNSEGHYNIQGMRNGGPYSINYAFVGYKTTILNDITLQFGNSLTINMPMEEDAQMLNEVVVVAQGSKFTGVKTGSSTNVNSMQMDRLPTIDRSLSDFTRLSPYTGATGAYGGMDTRMNTFTVDGANLNNNFGLSSGALPGGGNPISMDAIEEIQVVVAPYDVRQTSFVGAGVNAITKSGTNTVEGTIYSYFTNEDLRGNSIDGQDLGERPVEQKTTYGFTLGAPIVKDKLFIFVNGEYSTTPKQLTYWRTSSDGVADEANYISRVTQADMDAFATILRDQYGYEPGSSTDYTAETSNYKALARIDWNINNKNKFSARYNYTQNINQYGLNNGMPGTATASGHSSINSLFFSNSGYTMNNFLHSATAELNSSISDKVSNNLVATFTNVDDIRTSESADMPLIDIMKDGDMFMSAGHELYSYNNRLLNNTFTITDNVNINFKNHSLTAGLSYEHQIIENSFMAYGLGYYRYASLEDFASGAAPVAYALTYGYEGDDSPSADLTFAQVSAYAQDVWSPKENVKLTFGLRFDLPMYLNELQENSAISEAVFADGETLQTGNWPKSKVMVSPRIGWNWDVNNDYSLIIRGGTGIFTGRIPFIFFTNMPSNSGMIQNSVVYEGDDEELALLAGGVKTAAEVKDILNLPSTAAQTMPSTIASIDEDFVLPQIWKTSIAADIRLPLDFPATLSLEAMYTKNINAVITYDANVVSLDDESMTRFNGPDNRYMYPANKGKIYDDIYGAYVITNTNKGHSFGFNATVNTTPIKNMNVMLAYAASYAKEYTSNPGSTPSEMSSKIASVNGVNNLDLQYSQNMTPHKVVGTLTYKLDYAKNNLSTVFGLFYTGYSAGNASYIYSNDMNGDGVSNDLMYIPASKDELTFVDTDDFTAEQQADAFWAYVNQDKYLSKHKGEYAGAYATRLPWVHRFDLKIAQNFNVKVGNSTNVLQLSVDFVNIGNLLKDTWGVSQVLGNNSGKILTYQGVDATNTPTYTMYSYTDSSGKKTLAKDSFSYNRTTSECWQLQFGLKYMFN